MSVESVITENLDIWTSAIKTKSASGRGSTNKLELYGIKKLRELILELAVRGKLVPQDMKEEPAQILLEKIQEEKEQLVKDKKLKKSKKLESILIDDFPFDVPKTWEFERLGNVVDIIRGITFPASAKESESSEENIACLRTANVQDAIDWDDLIYVDKSFVKRDDQFLAKYDIVMSMANSRELVGKVAFADSIPVDASFGGFLSVLRPRKLFPDYVMLFLRTPYARETLIGSASQTTNIANISLEKLNPLIFPVPPLEEQNRIADKVKELMTLCDQLESEAESSIEAHKTLVETLLATLTNAKDADELNESWQRISEHFDTLFTTEDSIDQLKQTILQLAVMGKLVKQDPNDEPVEGLLDRIFEEQKNNSPTKKELNILEQEYLNAKSSVSGNRVQVKARFICNFITKGTTPSKNELLENGPVPFLKVYNIVNNEIDFEYRPIFISEDVHTGKLKRSIALPGDVLMNIVGPPLGKVAVLPDSYPSWNMNQALAVFKPQGGVLPEYLYYVLPTDTVLSSVLKEVKGTAGQDNLSLEQCRDLLIPLPSINEQKRIVEKIKALSSICDQLKASIRKSLSIKHCLADSVSSSLVN